MYLIFLEDTCELSETQIVSSFVLEMKIYYVWKRSTSTCFSIVFLNIIYIF